ncbi:hypothetical protein [Micromonospora sagamiensis]|uniref:Serine/threonine protein kinase n=1 Tax=Micromonospora sagamiensis TaxID=47875 RepID=A0A562WH88_9ACTN|nr:hypothetical protein [Micromonospora sagamiensis]TWJ29626.1 hypothetical protein JD81_03137 [Micromonospora sagamiensis]
MKTETSLTPVTGMPTSVPTHSEGIVIDWSAPRACSAESRRMTSTKTELPAGKLFRFGRSTRTAAVDPHAAHAIGAVRALPHCWSLSNLTSNTTFVVENLEGGTELIKVAPRRLDAVVPFEMSRVLVPSVGGLLELRVFAAPPTFLDSRISGIASHISLPVLDEQTKYFLVLVALCEPRLRGSSTAAVPSVQQVIERLRPAPGFANVNRSSINYHIDYLRQYKLPIDEKSMSSYGGRMHSKREALVAFALRYDLVREEHLNLLPGRRESTGQPGGRWAHAG